MPSESEARARGITALFAVMAAGMGFCAGTWFPTNNMGLIVLYGIFALAFVGLAALS